MAEQPRPDLIVLDVGLPSLNGIEAAQRIRNQSFQSDVSTSWTKRGEQIAHRPKHFRAA